MNQRDKAALFKSLHVKGDPLVLYNIWDAGGAKALADAGAPAIATGSWSMAAAHGFADGEKIPLDFVLQIVARIAASVDLPLTVDFEGGYATDPADVAQNITKVVQAGAVGINFEDRVVQGDGLYPVAAQAERIKAARAAADTEAVPLFINARTDLFLGSDPATHAALMDEALTRAAAYAAAGADGFFVPGLTDASLIRRVTDPARLPVNVMMIGALTSIGDVEALGVSRASFGPGPYVSAQSDLQKRYAALE
ncbi:MAG: isocitrate lyase/phosphoenolpyruvate mutase family protein [Pseudomonadota bacterium]